MSGSRRAEHKGTGNGKIIRFRLNGRRAGESIPASLLASSRGLVDSDADVFLPPGYLNPLGSFDISPAARSVVAGVSTGDRKFLAQSDDLVVFELADGGTLISSASALRDSLELSNPEFLSPDNEVMIEEMRTASAAPGRALGPAVKGVISKIHFLRVADDGINRAVLERLAIAGGRSATEILMELIEARVAGNDRLHRWSEAPAGDITSQLDEPLGQQGKPLRYGDSDHSLVFIHGTASNTAGSFGDLRLDPATWSRLEKCFGAHIYSFEHRTLSRSPIENAIELVKALPRNAKISLVSHSRGGLIADLLCLDSFSDLIEDYGVNASPRPDGDLTWVAQQREQLAVLNTLLHARKLDIRRYVRVASPANGTLLAAGNFDVFLSGLLTLIGAVPFFYGSPIYSAFKRIVIEIARNRTDAHLVPGIAAMLPDSPLAQFLRLARVRKGVEMAVVAGDVDAGNMLSRLAVMLTDFLLFDKEDNDLVVNTAAMLAGIASRARARVLYDRGSNVSHFRYFTNIHTREAMGDWLTEPDLSAKKLKKFLPLPSPASYVSPIGTASRSLDRANADRPLVVVIPGVLGSHLGTDQNSRVWLEAAEIQKNTLARLGLEENGIDALDLFEMSYGPLCKHLDATHRVACFPYDWRQSLETLGTRLGRFLREQMDQSKGPIRILAHGMGGLLVRACRHAHPGIIEALMEREGARFIMLGTPNHGTHAVVENLIGKGDAVRSIARMIPSSGGSQIDTVLNTFASFPGVLALLPAPDFKDTFQGEIAGGNSYDFHRRDTWSELKDVVSDKYFGEKHCAVPGADLLMQALWLWSQDRKQTASLPPEDEGRTIYVFGVARNTTCGIREELLPGEAADAAQKKRLRLVGTTRGDGLVTWKSGRSTGIGSYYYMPVQHGDLLATEEYFPALDELLATGSTTLLSQQAPTDRAADRVTPLRYDAAPPTILDEDALQRELMGGSLRNRVSARTRRRLAVQVKAMDVRFAARPIMVGHYEQDPIGGAEAVIDRELLNGDLGKRYGLGLYAGPRGSTTVVLRGAAENTKPRAHLTGAVVVGLGRLEDPLSAADLTEAVHTSALRYLLHIVDILGKDDREVQLASVLLGFNSSANIPVSASVEALVSGVMQANARLHEMTGLNIRVSSLDIIELYIDTAISAVYALRDLADRLAGQAESQGMSLVVNPELINGEGMRHRLINDRYSSYWPRLVVTDADRDESTPAVASDTGGKAQTNKLRFMFIGPRARAEVVVQQRQPGLVEALVREQVDNEVWDKEFGRMLFQLMVPHDFKDAARQLDRIVLVVDSHTANLPWELMLGAQDSDALSEEDELPLALRAAMVRQLSSTRFRAQVVRTAARNALVIGNPSVSGYHTAFEPEQATRDAGVREASFLQGAVDEAHTVADTLEKLNYHAMRVIGEKADKVLAALYRMPWRILHISAHGVFNQKHTDGGHRSGVLLSDGLLITAAEIAAMEVVPELVFLNCCHSGQIDGGQNRNKLAGSIARELIDIGVRCVLVAGWAVNDQQARTFGESFYKEILIRRRAFGDAVQKARRATWDANKQGITWGAFQAYGDPGWMAEPVGEDQADTRERRDYVAIDEVLDELARTRVRLSHQRDAIDEVDTQTVNRLVDNIKQRSPKSWLDLAPLHSALGTIRIELRDLEQAYIEFLAAIRREDHDGRVPIRDIEQLVKVEALLAEQLAEEAATMFQKELHAAVGGVSVEVTNVFGRAEKLIWTAVARLNGLNQLSTDISGSNQNSAPRDGLMTAAILDSETNWMRSALRGFVWKSMASLQARKLTCGIANGDHAKIRRAMLQYLDNAARAYGKAAGEPGSSHFSPALALTHLALESLTNPPNNRAHQGKRDENEALARHCSQHADQELAEKADIFSALIHPKAQLVEHMIIGNLGRELAGDVIIEEIAQAYADATSKIALKPSQLDEITTEIEAISRFCRALSLDPKRKKVSRKGRRAEMARTSERLELLAHRLQPTRLLSPSEATESAADDTQRLH